MDVSAKYSVDVSKFSCLLHLCESNVKHKKILSDYYSTDKNSGLLAFLHIQETLNEVIAKKNNGIYYLYKQKFDISIYKFFIILQSPMFDCCKFRM